MPRHVIVEETHINYSLAKLRLLAQRFNVIVFFNDATQQSALTNKVKIYTNEKFWLHPQFLLLHKQFMVLLLKIILNHELVH